MFPIPDAGPLRPMHCWQRTADSKPLFRAQKQMAHTKVFAALGGWGRCLPCAELVVARPRIILLGGLLASCQLLG